MKVLLLTLLVLLHCSASAQVDSITSNFLTDIIKRRNDTSIIYYANKVEAGIYHFYPEREIKRKVKDIDPRNKSTLFLSQNEIAYLKTQLKNRTAFQWPDKLFSLSQKIPSDSVNSFLINHRDQSLHIFSQPIFIRNNSICLFYIVHLCCGGIYGPVELSFFKKGKSEWKRWIRVEQGAF